MKTAILIFFLLSLVSCGNKKDKSCNEAMEKLDGRETALIIGDSISIGYTPTLKEEFSGLQVIHNECNGMNTKNGALRVDSWASHSPIWKFCIFNHGLWDLSYNDFIDIQTYLINLELEVDRLKVNCQNVIFINTTRIPENAADRFNRSLITQYNNEAELLMASLNIPVCNLNAVSETITDKHVNAFKKNDVHYTKEGYKVLGQSLATCIQSNI